MNIKDYSPTFRHVLLLEVQPMKTEGGIYIPHSSYVEDKEYFVVKAGKDCTEVQAKDTVKIARGVPMQEITLIEEGLRVKCFVVMEQQIVGYVRYDDSIRDAHSPEPAVSGNSQLQKG